MSSAPMSSTPDPKNVAGVDARLAPRAMDVGAALRGRLLPPALGRLGRGLVYGTGLFLLRPLLLLACRLVGWQRSCELRHTQGELRVERELRVLGMTLRRETEHLPLGRLASVSKLWARAPEPLALGALCLGVATIWGLWQLVDGLYGRSAALVGLGLGAIAAGVAVDLLLYWLASHLPGLTTQGMLVRTTDGRKIEVVDLPEASRDRLVDSIFSDIK